jgi:hypothetical protein
MVPWPGLDADDKKGLDIAVLSMRFYAAFLKEKQYDKVQSWSVKKELTYLSSGRLNNAYLSSASRRK